MPETPIEPAELPFARNAGGGASLLPAAAGAQPLLVRALLQPALTRGFATAQWQAVLLQARASGLLAKLAHRLQRHEVFEAAPYKARAHMHAAAIAARSSQTAVRFEVDRVLRALRGIDLPVLLMKGTAYLHAGLPPAGGRFIGDVDLMVPRARIDEVERALLAGGWEAADLDAYDQRYYREWTHEIPPLQHPERDTPVDVHHTIAPPTSRVHPDADAILAAALPLADPRLSVMAPADMVLHACVHLFNDEVGMPLRDLFDLHDLVGHFAAQPSFWPALQQRAVLHGLQRPAWYMLRQLRWRLGTEIPEPVWLASAGWRPGPLAGPAMAALLRQRFAPVDPERTRWAQLSAGTLLYLRAHWLRMPPAMLARHLAVKSWRGLREGRA